jgi:hypothetical protein
LKPHVAIEVDYQTYGEGEALMGWLNAALTISAPVPFDGNQLLLRLAGQLQADLQKENAEVAHLKMTLTPSQEGFDIGAVSVVRNEQQPELSHALQESLTGGDLILNLRAEAAPELLEKVTRQVVGRWTGAHLALAQLESFRPGQPNPTHRLSNPA